jgi:hypothetical protein
VFALTFIDDFFFEMFSTFLFNKVVMFFFSLLKKIKIRKSFDALVRLLPLGPRDHMFKFYTKASPLVVVRLLTSTLFRPHLVGA